MRRAVVTLLVLAGCLEPRFVTCDDGHLCPIDRVCHVDTCVLPEDLAACIDVLAGATCAPDRACHDGVCLPVGCGNGRLDPDERCDDGDTTSGNGCSAACDSDESCGNGMIDPVAFEQCDDGNLASHDGCDSACRVEELDWTPVVQLAAHPALYAVGAAFDHARERLVTFGGLDAGDVRTDRTYEWDGAHRTWIDRTPLASPTVRHGSAMAYDAARAVVVLFGGWAFDGAASDTWTWDGETWTLVEPAARPPARFFTGTAYDPRRQRVLVFGGRDALGMYLNDTWSWDGTTWRELPTTTRPPARERPGFAYDPRHDNFVLVGGNATSNLQDTWLFEADTWRQVAPIEQHRIAPALVFDPTRDGLVVSGGITAPDKLWDGTTWRVETLATQLQGRIYATGYFDARRGALVAGGGAQNGEPAADMRVHDAETGWMPLAIEPGIVPARSAPMMAFDHARAQVLLFGGFSGSDLDDLYAYERAAWHRLTDDVPPGRDRAAMAYDEARQRVVLWGGHSVDVAVWEWDGIAWEQRPSALPGPPNRGLHELTYVPGTGVVLFAGGFDQAQPLGDMWIWDGVTWTEVTAPRPPARVSHAMGYDPVRGELVVFGGAAGDMRLGDTWTWRPVRGWVRVTPTMSPMPRSRMTMTWDPVRARLVMFGGLIGSIRIDETWTWDGTTWSRVFTDHRPPPQVETVLAFDRVTSSLVMHGADGTWHLGWRSATRFETCPTAGDLDGDGLAGCADPDCTATCSGCGDGTCSVVESCRTCVLDCGVCMPWCGDRLCTDGEGASCPGDCP